MGILTNHLRRTGPDETVGHQLGLLLLRYAVEIAYVAAVPQFRYGLSKEEEEPWDGGQTDWASTADPIASLYRKGMLRYSIDIPIVSRTLALAYDTIWPLLQSDRELVERVRALGVEVAVPGGVVDLIEEMLSCLMQCCVDGGGLSNLPRTSLGVLTVLRALERPDGQDVMTWLYDRGPAKLRVFTTNNFFPDGTPPESTGGYNNGHTSGLFELEYSLRRLREASPDAYPESEFPSLIDDPRAARTILAPHETAVLGKASFGFGDGSSSGVQGGRMVSSPSYWPIPAGMVRRAAEFTFDPAVIELARDDRDATPRALGTTIHDGVGIAIMRTGEAPERAAAGIVYGDATGHRHMDLLDVQLFAFEHPFLTDLGYPQSWASVTYWEGNWATHNALWGVVPELGPLELPFDTPWFFLKQIAGRGRLVRTLFADGLQVLEVEAERWAWDPEKLRWFRPGVSFRRLLALLETDGDGIALIDLSRVEDLAHPDYAGLACMDQVEELDSPASWSGTWTSHRDADVQLDLHQVGVNPGTRVLTARSTAVMGTPEESRYNYRTLLWRREPDSVLEPTRVDLVFEPRMGPATLEEVSSIAVESGQRTASGLRVTTRSGRHLELYWAPDADQAQRTCYEGGVELEGRLAVVFDGRVAATGATALRLQSDHHSFVDASQTGTVQELDRMACTIVVAGLRRIAAGDRVRLNPDGRGHNYKIVAATELAPQRHLLKLDVSSVLGRARVASTDGCRVELEFNVMARTDNLHQTRLQRQSDHLWSEIAEAMNRDADHTTVLLMEPLAALQPGEWVAAVDYVVGDPVAFEPSVSTSTIPPSPLPM